MFLTRHQNKQRHPMYTQLLIFFIALSYAAVYNDAVMLKDIQVLTLHKGRWTTGKRSAPITQLNCIGGSAKHLAQKVEIVQCYNKGFDGRSQAWECVTEIDKSIKLGEVTVSCEGYHYPDDPQVLVGSCALEYSLEFSSLPRQPEIVTTTTTIRSLTPLDNDFAIIPLCGFLFAGLCVACYVMMSFICTRTESSTRSMPITSASYPRDKPTVYHHPPTQYPHVSTPYTPSIVYETPPTLVHRTTTVPIQQTTIINQVPVVQQQQTTYINSSNTYVTPRYDTVETRTTTSPSTSSADTTHVSKSYGGTKGR